MRIAVYGGSFNPPHLGHLDAAQCVSASIKPDKFLIIPDNLPPHKEMAEGSPNGMQRLEMCRAQFDGIENVEISNMELLREGRSYTCHTVAELRRQYPEDEIFLVVGTDMLMTFDEWRNAEYLFRECTLTALTRDDGDDAAMQARCDEYREKFDARITLIPHTPLPMSSSDIRAELSQRKGVDKLTDAVYSLIIKHRYYCAEPDFDWLRDKSFAMLDKRRIPHVAGCEIEAARLAQHWGADPETAAVAGILHDCTKRLKHDKQLLLCEKYGIILDNVEKNSPQLLHSKTGAAVARDVFGVSDEIYEAIRWHTTGKADMSLMEKIIYLADYIEQTRDFPGVDMLRQLAYTDLDMAMAKGLEMSVQDIRARNIEPHVNTLNALNYYSAEN